MIYGDRPIALTRFEETDFEKRVDRAALIGTPRRMDRALEYAAQVLAASVRRRKIVILLTTGRQSPGGKSLDEAVNPLDRLGAHTFVVAIGQGPANQELLATVDRARDVFTVVSPNELPSRTQRIGTDIRDKPSKYRITD